MKRILFILFFAGFLLSCEQPHAHFTIKNSSGTKLWVQYYYTLSNGGAYTVPVYIGESKEVYSSEGMNSGGPPNWKDYKIWISKIINDNSDTINFDPNLQEAWVLGTSATRNDYLLTITDQSF